MRIAICDDEEEIRVALAEKLKNLFPLSALSAYSSGTALPAAPPPYVLLLDIQMPGPSGMEIAQELRRRNGKMVLIHSSQGDIEYYGKLSSLERQAEKDQTAIAELPDMAVYITATPTAHRSGAPMRT